MPGASDLGISTGGLTDGPARRAVECLLAIAFYNFVELVVIIQTAFKRRQGLYYWSFVVATWGIAIYSVGFLTKDLSLIRNGAIYGTFIVLGWTCMVTGQSMVLWSRMHLLVRNKRTLRTILIIIVVDAIIGHVPTSVVLYGSNSPHPEQWLDPYAILERCHVTLFFLQELAISTIYIVETTKLLRTKPSMPRSPIIPNSGGGSGGGGGGSGGQQKGGKGRLSTGSMSSRDKANASARQFLMRLIYINVLVVVLDITIVALEYAGLYVIQTAYKALVYSVKLKLEFSILNSLVEMMKAHRNARDGVHRSTPPLSGCCSSRDTTLGSDERQSKRQRMMVASPLMGGMPRQTYTPMTFSRLTQTIDEDGQIRYNNTTSANGSTSNSRMDSRIDGGGGIFQSTHSRPESVYYSPQSRDNPLAQPDDDITMTDTVATASQFVIRRDRREDWEDKSDLDELVLEGGIQSIMTE